MNHVDWCSNWARRGVAFTALLLLVVHAAGCGQASGPTPLDDPQIDQTVQAVQAGKESPAKLRRLLKEKVSGKSQEKAMPKQLGKPRRPR